MLIDKIKNCESTIFLYGITPPKWGTDQAKIAEIAQRQINRIAPLNLDGLILYDLQDEASRTDEKRPFPYLETINPFEYSRDYLQELAIPKIIYRSVGKYRAEELQTFIDTVDTSLNLTIFVGAPSQSEKTALSLSDAYKLKEQSDTPLLLGGVTIPERHRKKGDDHLRLQKKVDQGCSFFVSQGVYDLQEAKDMLSDYHYFCKESGNKPVPIIFTFTPCGSKKTMEFMKWLGISIPRWLENELNNSENILEKSLDICEYNWTELKTFAEEKNMPIGCNIESVAIRKVEVDASIELLHRVRAI